MVQNKAQYSQEEARTLMSSKQARSLSVADNKKKGAPVKDVSSSSSSEDSEDEQLTSSSDDESDTGPSSKKRVQFDESEASKGPTPSKPKTASSTSTNETKTVIYDKIAPTIPHKLSIELESFTDNEAHGTEMILRFKGSFGSTKTGFEEILINGIRHTMMGEVVTYGVGYGSIDITKNQSDYEEHYMSRRLVNLPVLKVVPKVEMLERTYYPYVKGVYGTLKPDREYKNDPRDTTEIRMVLNVENNEERILNVTAEEHLKVFVNDEEFKMYDNKKFPLLLFKLKRGDRMSFQLRPVLGIGNLQNTWNPVSNCFLRGEPGNVQMVLRSFGQMSEAELVKRTCRVLCMKMDRFISNLHGLRANYIDAKVASLTIEHEDEAMGELLSYALAMNDNVTFPGYKMDHPLVAEIKLLVEVQKKDPIGVTISTMESLKRFYTDVERQMDEFMKVKPKKVVVDLEALLATDSDDEEGDDGGATYESEDGVVDGSSSEDDDVEVVQTKAQPKKKSSKSGRDK
jgi:DNA-directed RNA polymerase subunit L